MNIIDATYFSLNGTTTATTIVSTLENRIIELPYDANDRLLILESAVQAAPEFAGIIEAYLQVKNTSDEHFTETMIEAMDAFTMRLK